MATSRTAVVAACPAGARPAAPSPGLRAKGSGGVSWIARRTVARLLPGQQAIDLGNMRRQGQVQCPASVRPAKQMRELAGSLLGDSPGEQHTVPPGIDGAGRIDLRQERANRSQRHRVRGRERLLKLRGCPGIEYVDSGQPDALAGQPLDMADHPWRRNIRDRCGNKGGAAAPRIADRRYQAINVRRGDQGRPGGQDHLTVMGVCRRQDHPDHMRDPRPPRVRGINVLDEALM